MSNILNRDAALVAVDTLSTHPDNPRAGNMVAIQESIRLNGFYGFIVAQQSSRFILAGNHRFQAAVAEGFTEVPVVFVDVDDDRAKRILLADNRTSDLGGYSEVALAELLQGIQNDTGTLDGTAYTEDDLRALLDQLAATAVNEDEKESAETDSAGVKYSIVIECYSEDHQAELLKAFRADGLLCNALIE